MAKKKTKDLDPKGRASKVRGGNLPDDEQNINRSAGAIKKAVTDPVTNLPKKGIRLNP